MAKSPLVNMNAKILRTQIRTSAYTQDVIDRMASRDEYASIMTPDWVNPEDDAPVWRTEEDIAIQQRDTLHQDLFFHEQERHLRPEWMKDGKSEYKTYNYCRFVTNTYADLLVGGGAEIKTPYAVVDNYIKDEAEIPMKMYKWMQLISIFGRLGLQVVADDQGVTILSIHPSIIYPEFDESGTDYVSISKKYPIDPADVRDPQGRWSWDLRHEDEADGIIFEERHYKGFIEYWMYVVSGDVIVEALPATWYDPNLPSLNSEGVCRVDTNVDDFMLMIIPNELILKKFISDYQDIVDQQSGINSRATQTSRVLNIHADPKLMLPSTMQQRDPLSGRVTTRGLRDEVLFIEPEDNAVFVPQYLTWQAQLDEGYIEMDRDRNAILTMTQISASLVVTDDGQSGFPESAAAYKLKLTPTLNRANVKRGDITRYIKRVVAVFVNKLLELGTFDTAPDLDAGQHDAIPDVSDDGTQNNINKQTKVKPRDIDINCIPAIPQDEKFLVERAGGAPTASRERILREIDKMTPEEVTKELAAIDKDETSTAENYGDEAGRLQFGNPNPSEGVVGGEEIRDSGLHDSATGIQTAGLGSSIS